MLAAQSLLQTHSLAATLLLPAVLLQPDKWFHGERLVHPPCWFTHLLLYSKVTVFCALCADRVKKTNATSM
jgi:hypothetical protein